MPVQGSPHKEKAPCQQRRENSGWAATALLHAVRPQEQVKHWHCLRLLQGAAQRNTVRSPGPRAEERQGQGSDEGCVSPSSGVLSASVPHPTHTAPPHT